MDKKNLIFLISFILLFGLCITSIVLLLGGGSYFLIQPRLKDRMTLFPVFLHGKWGYINAKGNLVIDFQFDEARDFHQNIAAVKIGYRWGYIDIFERYIRNPIFDSCLDFSEDFAAVSIDNQWGYISNLSSQKYAIPPTYEAATSFSEGLAAVKLKGKWGYINKKGDVVIPFQFDYGGPFTEGLAYVVYAHKLGYINSHGQLIINPRFDFPDYIDLTMNPIEWIISEKNKRYSFKEGIALAVYQGRYGYIAPNGDTLIDFIYSDALPFSEGLAAVKDGNKGKWGFIDKQGNFVIEPKYNQANSFSEGLAAVKLSTKWGYINIYGLPLIRSQFTTASQFNHGLALVDQRRYISTTGEIIWEGEPFSNIPTITPSPTNTEIIPSSTFTDTPPPTPTIVVNGTPLLTLAAPTASFEEGGIEG